jgi:hypothetical protein
MRNTGARVDCGCPLEKAELDLWTVKVYDLWRDREGSRARRGIFIGLRVGEGSMLMQRRKLREGRKPFAAFSATLESLLFWRGA